MSLGDWTEVLGASACAGAGFAAAHLTSSYKNDPVGRLRKAYNHAYRCAQDDGDWSLERISTAMRERTIPGAYVESAGSLFEQGMEAWRRRLTPRELKHASRAWK